MNSNKKVLVLNPYLPTLGGGEKHMAYFCQFIERYYNYNVDIDILVYDYNDISIKDENYITIDDVNRQFGLELKKTKLLKLELAKPKTAKQSAINDKIIENTAIGYDIMINFMFQSRHVGKAKTNIYGCMFPPRKRTFSSRKKDLVINKIMDVKFFDSYQLFISNSKYTNLWLERFWGPNDKSVVIYPPVFSKNEIAGRYQETKKENIIISVGRFFVGDHSKKQLDLVKFFINNPEKFRNYEYHLVGAISNDSRNLRYLEKIKKIASKENNVFVHENCPFNELISLYERAKIFWHATGYKANDEIEPEKMEHFGITTVEAMSYGVVPVVIKKGGQIETVKEGINGFLWETEEECINKSSILIEDDQLRMKLALESSINASDYSIETFYERNEVIFHELQL